MGIYKHYKFVRSCFITSHCYKKTGDVWNYIEKLGPDSNIRCKPRASRQHGVNQSIPVWRSVFLRGDTLQENVEIAISVVNFFTPNLESLKIYLIYEVTLCYLMSDGRLLFYRWKVRWGKVRWVWVRSYFCLLFVFGTPKSRFPKWSLSLLGSKKIWWLLFFFLFAVGW